MLKLYDDPISGNGYKIRLLLAQLEIPYVYVPVDIQKGESRTPEFLAKNPNGRIPLLELPDGSHLAESRIGASSSPRRTRLPTSRCTPTPTSVTRGGSISSGFPLCGLGWDE